MVKVVSFSEGGLKTILVKEESAMLTHQIMFKVYATIRSGGDG